MAEWYLENSEKYLSVYLCRFNTICAFKGSSNLGTQETCPLVPHLCWQNSATCNTWYLVHTVVSQYRFYCTYSGLSIQVLLYIQWSLNTGSTVHTVVSQYRFYCTYSGLSIQVLLYIQWSLNTGSTVHTVVSQYRFYCTYSGLSVQVLYCIYSVCNKNSFGRPQSTETSTSVCKVGPLVVHVQ